MRKIISYFSEKRVLITGGAGFVGSHLANIIINYANYLIILDNLSTGNMKNIEYLLNKYKNKVTFVNDDIRNMNTCLEVTKNVDIIFHLAAQINPVKAVKKPFYDFEVNARGTLNILEAARKNDVSKLIYASTNVYGNPKYLPTDENHPIDLLSPYAASKLAGEAYTIVYNNTYGLNTVRLRFSNIYGPGQTTKSESGVIAIFIERILSKQPIIIFGNGEQTRDFVYIDDVVEALVRAAIVSEANGEVFNIGSGNEITINRLAKMIIKIINNLVGGKLKTEILYGPSRSADFHRACYDISKARKILGYVPKVSIEEGLKRTIIWNLNRNKDSDRR